MLFELVEDLGSRARAAVVGDLRAPELAPRMCGMSKSRPLTAALASPRELQPRRGMPLHAPAEVAVDDLADRFEQPRALLRR